MNGKPLSVGKFKGHPVLLQFWSPTSSAYLQELPGQLALFQKFHPKGFEIIGVVVDDHEFTVKKFLKDTGLPWPQYFDGKVWDNKLAERYGVDGLPSSFLIGADGKIVGIDLRALAIDELLTKMLPK
jgi:thiol-disulfide isomerase/thioredoxin